MRSRTAVLLATMTTLLLAVSGVAWAAVIACPTSPAPTGEGGLCEGTTGDDEMTGTSDTDYIYAKEGNDTLRGLGDFDDLRGGPGNDDLDGGRGNDQYNVYDANWGADRISGDESGAKDWLIFQIGSGALTIDLVPSPDRPEVSAGANKINFASDVVIEWVQAGPGGDTIKGSGVANYLSGAGGGDRLVGRGGNDQLAGDITEFGNNGNDKLDGGPGKDILTGGRGQDKLVGAEGDDDLSDIHGLDTGHEADADNVFGGRDVDTIDVDDGDNLDVVCTGGGADDVTSDPGDPVDDPSFC